MRELGILQVGYITRMEYEYAHHIEIGQAAGLSDADIRAIADETNSVATHLTTLERNVLAAAREIVAEPTLSDPIFAALSSELDTELVIDLIMIISFYCAVVRVLGVLKIDLEDHYRHYLTKFPLPI